MAGGLSNFGNKRANPYGAKPNKRAPLGQGGRFAYVEQQAAASGARNPAAVAASAGRKAHGAKKMAQLAARGRKAHVGKRTISAYRSPR